MASKYPYLGELRIMPYNFAPKGWALCNGQLLSIQGNNALFSLIGTTYGGDGKTNFAVPNLQGRAPIGVGNGFKLGQQTGEYEHGLTVSEMPAHRHEMKGKAATASAATPGPNASLAQGRSSGTGTPNVDIFGTGTPTVSFAQDVTTLNGFNQPHDNTQPYLALSICIATQGVFPSHE
jgi:microcystin-dependent protein